MDDDNEILELEDFNLEVVSPEDVVESLGLKNCSTELLLNLLKKGAESAKIILQSFDRADMKEYYGIGKRYSPVAFEVYDRLFKQGKEPRILTYLAVNRHSSTCCKPDTIIFWDDPDAIRGLYESLEKDGYYASSPRT